MNRSPAFLCISDNALPACMTAPALWMRAGPFGALLCLVPAVHDPIRCSFSNRRAPFQKPASSKERVPLQSSFFAFLAFPDGVKGLPICRLDGRPQGHKKRETLLNRSPAFLCISDNALPACMTAPALWMRAGPFGALLCLVPAVHDPIRCSFSNRRAPFQKPASSKERVPLQSSFFAFLAFPDGVKGLGGLHCAFF